MRSECFDTELQVESLLLLCVSLNLLRFKSQAYN